MRTVTGGSRASRRVFASMLERVLWAPMSYFQTTPMGRILNRFTFDTEVIDVLLTQVMSMFLISCSWYVAGVVLMCTILPWMLLAIVPVTAAFWFLLLHYRRSATDLQRLDALSRSPIQAMISEGLCYYSGRKGVTVVRFSLNRVFCVQLWTGRLQSVFFEKDNSLGNVSFQLSIETVLLC